MMAKINFFIRALVAGLMVCSMSEYICAEEPSVSAGTRVDHIEYNKLIKIIAIQKKNGISNAHITEYLIKEGTPTARIVLEEFLASLENGVNPEPTASNELGTKGIAEDLFWAATAGVFLYWIDTKKAIAIAGAAGIFFGYRLYRRFKL